MTTMDVSHIREILTSLTKNHVTVPIITNQYEETCCMDMYNSVMNNECEKLDDFYSECLKHQEADYKNNGKKQEKLQTKPHTNATISMVDKPTVCGETSCGTTSCGTTSCIRSLLVCLYTLKNQKSIKESQNTSKINIMQFLLEMKEFTTKTLLKDLDVSKFKVTKKKLKEDLDFVYANVDTTNKLDSYIEQVKSLIIVASRYLVYELHIQGELTLDVLCKDASAKSAQIQCKDSCFTIVA